jgi:thiol-disulfide isomerase/thioredoxin
MPHYRHVLMPVLATTAMLLGACQKPAPQPEAAQPQAQQAPAAAKPEAAPAPAGGQPASADAATPALKVATTDGRQYDLAEHRGKWVVVNFWATWCKPCLKEMPELSALDTMREHIEVVGLAYEEIESADMQAFLEKHPVAYPIAIVDTYSPPADFDTPRGLPMTYLIGPNGRIADKFLGPVTAHDIESAIAKAGGPQAAPAKPEEKS